MKRQAQLLLILLLLVPSLLSAQGIGGLIKNTEGEPLGFATLFVQETGSGTAANESGRYELRLEPGTYNLVFQHLGHQTRVEQIAVGERWTNKDVILTPRTLDLQLVEIYDGREDPAYTVMRKAIAKAGYHRQQLDAYQAEVYIKGSGRIRRIPGLFRKLAEKEGIDSTRSFTSESVTQVRYTRPNNYEEKVVSIYTQGEDMGQSPNSYIFGSFYEPNLQEAVSPLSPRAFAYYRFEHEGFFMDRGYGVNKIKVIPRAQGEDVFSGSIYIVEDLWSIYRLDLTTWHLGIKFQIEQVYAPIQDKVWMPTSHRIGVFVKMLGFWFDYHYLAAVSDYEVTLNPELNHEVVVVDEHLDHKLAQAATQAADALSDQLAAERLARVESLTRKDLRKIIRDYEKEERRQQDEPTVVSERTYTIDSMATKRDSLYWETIRPVPLDRFEVRGYHVEDSMRQVQQQESDEEDESSATIEGPAISGIVFGDSYKLGKKARLSHGMIGGGFNPVEGYYLTKNIRFRSGKKSRLRLNTTLRYAGARDRFSAKGEVLYYFRSRKANYRRHYLGISGGRYISQYRPNTINPIVNALSNLLFHRNYIRLYEKEYVQPRFRLMLHDKYRLEGSLEYARRYRLTNRTSRTWLARDGGRYAPNEPANLTYQEPDRSLLEHALTLRLGITARPWQKYRIYNGRKLPSHRSTPELQLRFEAGLPGKQLDTEFKQLEARFSHNWRLGVRGKLGLNLFGGFFWDQKGMGFADYQHFAGNRTWLTVTGVTEGYRLLPYYLYSTRDKYAGAFGHYQFRRFLFTRIPEVSLLGIRENLFVNHLMTPEMGQYTELGYSLDNILQLARLELAFSFRNGQYEDWGILIGVATAIGAD